MVSVLVSIVLNAIAVYIAAMILPGIAVSSFSIALIVSIVLALFASLVPVVLILLPLPPNIWVISLTTFVLMALLVLLCSAIVPGFVVNGFLWAFVFAFVLAILNGFLHSII